ncbi:transmembrane protein 182 [Lampetra fluviatilis]
MGRGAATVSFSVATFIAALLAAGAAFFALLAFGTDYWLLVTKLCPAPPGPNATAVAIAAAPTDAALSAETTGGAGGQQQGAEEHRDAFFLHEGFFFRCWISGEDNRGSLWNFWLAPHGRKNCSPSRLFPLPDQALQGNSTSDSHELFALRQSWTVLLLVALGLVLVAGLLAICASPKNSALAYKVAGGIFVAAGVLLLLVLLLLVLWLEALVSLEGYVSAEAGGVAPPARSACPDGAVGAHYGWSFIVAALAVPQAVLAGVLFLLIGRALCRYPYTS